MSDILIKNMKIPESCPCKLVGVGYDMYCSFAFGIPARVKQYYECCENGTRPDWCPLFEVPSADVQPVVRCKDCSHSHKTNYPSDLRICLTTGCFHSENHFCSDGKRMDGET